MINIMIIVVIIVMLLFSSIKILQEYQRAVVFNLGRFLKVKGPGLIIVIPFIQKMARVDIRTIVMDVPSQDVISKDNSLTAHFEHSIAITKDGPIILTE